MVSFKYVENINILHVLSEKRNVRFVSFFVCGKNGIL